MSAVTAAGEVPLAVNPITEPFFSLLSQPAAFSPPAFFFFGRVQMRFGWIARLDSDVRHDPRNPDRSNPDVSNPDVGLLSSVRRRNDADG